MMKRLVLCILISSIIFLSCNNNSSNDLNFQHLEHVAACINNDLTSVKNDIINLASAVQYKIPFYKDLNETLSDRYYIHPGEILYYTNSTIQSAAYLPANKNLTPQLKKLIKNSELLDTFFVNTLINNPLLSQVYFLDTNSFLRIYPYIDVVSYLKSSIDLTRLNSYQTVKNQPFIQDRAYWANQPFADPYGRGWIVSCIEPIYYREQFIGMISGDITLRSIKNKYLSSDTELIILTDHSGKIICCTKEAAKITNVPPIREFQYYKPVTEDIYAFDNPSLLNHKNKKFKNAVKSLLSGKNKAVFYIDSKKYTIYKSQIRETNWLLLKIIN